MHSTYRDLSIHRWMLRDGVRNDAYRRALTELVRPGTTVLDVGAGTGVLDVFAVRAGASRVYAVERTDIAEVTRRLIADNGVADRVTVIHSDVEDAELPEKVDAIVSEWMGGLGIDENMLAPVVIARDRWLKPGGAMIPARVTAWLAPASLPEFDDATAYWRSAPHDLALGVIGDLTTHETFMTQLPITPGDLLAAPQTMWSHDMYTCTLADADRSSTASLTYTAAHAGTLSGVVAWFTADMGGGVELTNAVGAPDTHWGRLLFPLATAIEVAEGAQIHIELSCDPSSEGSCEFSWSIALDGAAPEHHDTRRGRRSKRDQF